MWGAFFATGLEMECLVEALIWFLKYLLEVFDHLVRLLVIASLFEEVLCHHFLKDGFVSFVVVALWSFSCSL